MIINRSLTNFEWYHFNLRSKISLLDKTSNWYKPLWCVIIKARIGSGSRVWVVNYLKKIELKLNMTNN